MKLLLIKSIDYQILKIFSFLPDHGMGRPSSSQNQTPLRYSELALAQGIQQPIRKRNIHMKKINKTKNNPFIFLLQLFST